MIKRMISKKIIISSLALFSLFLLTKFPKNEFKIQEISTIYTSDNNFENVYLLNDYNLLSLTKVVDNSSDIITKAKSLLEILIKDSKGEDKIPSGFKPIIPSDTKVLNIEFDKNTLKINFSKELLDVDSIYEEKVIESIVYTLTSIKDVKNIIIYIEGEILNYLPKSKKNIPTNLTRKFGINKIYDITGINDVSEVIVYYLSKYNDLEYYVPITMYVNGSIDKIRVIIDKLSSSPLYHTNLMSYLDNNAELLKIEEVNNELKLEFNNYIFNDFDTKDILEEVIDTISLSIKDNYDVDYYSIIVNNEEIIKKQL